MTAGGQRQSVMKLVGVTILIGYGFLLGVDVFPMWLTLLVGVPASAWAIIALEGGGW